jgi:2,3-bisphosphoglycerate-dependent phosphoglycerate mutase
MTYLTLVRHGRSEWNDKGLWTGFTDVSLVEQGRQEAKKAAKALKGLPIDLAYTSLLKRAQETLSIILNELKLSVPVAKDFALNERNYGIYTGKNKWEVKEAVGEKVFQEIRRSWDYPIPDGESLKQVYERVIPYYEKEILPKLKENKNVIIAASGNSLRALIKYLEHIPDESISEVEIGTGEAWIYTLQADGTVAGKEIRAKNETKV